MHAAQRLESSTLEELVFEQDRRGDWAVRMWVPAASESAHPHIVSFTVEREIGLVMKRLIEEHIEMRRDLASLHQLLGARKRSVPRILFARRRN